MNHIWKKIGILMVGAMIIVGQAVSGVSAQTQKKPTCSPADALRNWDTFLAAAISYEGFVEYWKEVIGYHNDCQYQDIVQAQSKIDGLEKSIRSAFYTCSNSRVELLKPQYYKAKAELYYVRNYVNTKDGNFVVVNEDKLRADMVQEFSTNQSLIDATTLDKYITEFRKKYKERPKVYQNCRKNIWGQVNKKWKELEKHFKDLKKSMEPKPSPPEKKDANQTAATKDAAKNKGGSFLSKIFSATVNGQEPTKSLAAIQQGLQKQLPSTTVPNVQQVSNVFGNAEQKQEALVSKKEMLDRYKVLYKQSGDQAFDDLKAQMKTINATIKATIPVIGRWKECAKKVGGRQCK